MKTHHTKRLASFAGGFAKVHIGAHADAKATVRDHRSHSQISEIGHFRSCWLENQIDLELDFDFNRD